MCTTVPALISHAVNDKIRDFQHTDIAFVLIQRRRKEAVFGITISTKFTIGVWKRDRDKNNAKKLSRLLLQYKAARELALALASRGGTQITRNMHPHRQNPLDHPFNHPHQKNEPTNAPTSCSSTSN